MNPKRKPSHDPVKIIGITRASEIQTQNQLDRTTRYEAMYDAALLLDPGDVLEIAPDRGEDLHRARERIGAAIRRGPGLWSEHAFVFRITSQGTVGVYCISQQDAQDKKTQAKKDRVRKKKRPKKE